VKNPPASDLSGHPVDQDPRFLPRVRASDPRARLAITLVAVTAAYNVIEAIVAIGSGVAADSIALIAFGLDSLIELGAAAFVLWRLRLEFRDVTLHRLQVTERRVHRLVGWTLLALAAYVLVDAAWTLWRHNKPEGSLIGIVLAGFSVIAMPLIGWAKLRVAHALGSGALHAEAIETLACAWLSAALLVGLVANALLGWWWADPLAAIAMIPWLLNEGREALSSS